MSDRISLVNQIWPNKRRDGGETGREGRRERRAARTVALRACISMREGSEKERKSERGREAKGCGKREETGRRTNLRSFESGQLEEQTETGGRAKRLARRDFSNFLCVLSSLPASLVRGRLSFFSFLFVVVSFLGCCDQRRNRRPQNQADTFFRRFHGLVIGDCALSARNATRERPIISRGINACARRTENILVDIFER